MIKKASENKILARKLNEKLQVAKNEVHSKSQETLDQFIEFDNNDQAYEYFGLEKPKEEDNDR